MKTVPRNVQVVARDELAALGELPEELRVTLGDIAGVAREGLLALSVATGMSVMQAMFEAEVAAVAGPKGQHDPERSAVRHGTERGSVTLGGRRVPVTRPRARTVNGHEVPLPPDEAVWASAPDAAGELEALVAWSAESTVKLLSALRDFGPDRACWTWWGGSQSPQNSGAVARHQLQHVTVHAYDAQVTQGAAQPLPHEPALDGVDEFLSTSVAGTDGWPHEPADIRYHATDGRSWRLSLTDQGAQVTRLDASGAMNSDGASQDPGGVHASLQGTASELLLAFYGRVPVDSLEIGGDRRVFDQLLSWDPDA